LVFKIWHPSKTAEYFTRDDRNTAKSMIFFIVVKHYLINPIALFSCFGLFTWGSRIDMQIKHFEHSGLSDSTLRLWRSLSRQYGVIRPIGANPVGNIGQ
jgi:hypothetical protein